MACAIQINLPDEMVFFRSGLCLVDRDDHVILNVDAGQSLGFTGYLGLGTFGEPGGNGGRVLDRATKSVISSDSDFSLRLKIGIFV